MINKILIILLIFVLMPLVSGCIVNVKEGGSEARLTVYSGKGGVQGIARGVDLDIKGCRHVQAGNLTGDITLKVTDTDSGINCEVQINNNHDD